MPKTLVPNLSIADKVAHRADALYGEHRTRIAVRTDQLFAVLMAIQWPAGIFVAYLVSPRTWSGSQSQLHLHVFAAIFLGGLVALMPIALVVSRPGRVLNRYVIAIAQMLTSSLLIHLTGGRIETHFHVFGSLAFLAVYRDWKVLIPAVAVVATDHLVRGVIWPYSVYGVLYATPWRTVEHAGWVLFESLFLVRTVIHSVNEMQAMALQRAQIEASHQLVEDEVTQRTAELAASEGKMRAIMDGAGDGIISIDERGEIMSCNDAAERIFAYSHDELVGRNISLLMPSPHREQHNDYLRRYRATGLKTVIGTAREVIGVRADGSQFPLEIHVSEVKTGADRFFTGILRDISERRKLTESLRASQERLEVAFSGTSDGLWDWDIATGNCWLSPRCSELLGDEPGDPPLSFERWQARLHPESLRGTLDALQAHLDRKVPFDVEYRLLTRGGTYRWFRARGAAVRNEAGAAVRMAGSISDIEERKGAEKELEVRLRQQEVVAWLGQFSLKCRDPQTIMQQTVELVSGTLDVNLCKVLELLPDGDRLLLRAGVGWREGLVGRATVGTGLDSQAGFTLVSAEPVIVDDLKKEARFSGPPLLHEHGVVSGISVVINGPDNRPFGVLGAHSKQRRCFSSNDVNFVQSVAHVLASTLQRKRADVLAREGESLRDAVSGLDRVLGVVGHELRTPLAAIRAMSELLITDVAKETDEYDKFLLSINEQSVQMAEMINDLLEVARHNSGTARWNWESVSLEEACLAGLDAVRLLIDPNKLALEVAVDPPGLQMNGDPAAIRRLIVNLVNNSFKNTEKGFIRVSARAFEVSGEPWVRLSVQDSGKGIKPEVAARLGEAFALNAGVVGESHISGTGLGLAICKGIVAAHGGSIEVESAEGQGTTVAVQIRTNLSEPVMDIRNTNIISSVKL